MHLRGFAAAVSQSGQCTQVCLSSGCPWLHSHAHLDIRVPLGLLDGTGPWQMEQPYSATLVQPVIRPSSSRTVRATFHTGDLRLLRHIVCLQSMSATHATALSASAVGIFELAEWHSVRTF